MSLALLRNAPDAVERLRSEHDGWVIGDRALSASAMVARLQSVLPVLGITRVGRLTGLDRIGIPVWMACRPNAANLSVSQGKATSDDAAAISAIMESVELAMAERPHPRSFLTSRLSLGVHALRDIASRRYLRMRADEPSASSEQRWVWGWDLLTATHVAVPAEIVELRDIPTTTYWQTSDGLAAGATLTEAVVHGICELIERDAAGLHSFRTRAEMLSREVDPRSWGVIATLERRIANAGLRLRLFDITTDLEIPAYLAVLVPMDRHRRLTYLDLPSGSGAHPKAAKAAERAVLEAVQTRLTTISGARDDISPNDYDRPLPPALEFYLDEHPRPPNAQAPTVVPSSAPAMLGWLLDRIRARDAGPVVLVSLESEDLGFTTVRMLAPGLEQDPGTRNRRLGHRAIAAMLGDR